MLKSFLHISTVALLWLLVRFTAVSANELDEAEAKRIISNIKKEIDDIRNVRKQTIVSIDELLSSKDTSMFKYKLTSSFTFSQVHYTPSWQDGVNSVGFRIAAYGSCVYIRNNLFVRFAPDVAYARSTEKDVSIKKEDRLALNLSSGWRLFSKYNFFLSGQIDLKTQFDKGEGNLYTGEKGIISKFFSPAYLVSVIGLRYNTPFHARVTVAPVSGRFIFVNDTSLSRYVGGMFKDNTPHAFKKELGAYVEFIYEHKVIKNIFINSKLELFSNYQDKPQNMDVDWNTTIDLKVSKWLSVIIFNRLVYRDKSRYYIIDTETGTTNLRGPDIQWNESINIGISYTLEH